LCIPDVAHHLGEGYAVWDITARDGSFH
jgi:hypothetical protein